MKKTIRIILLLLVVLGAAFFILRTPDTDRTEMIAKYGNEASRFLDDGHGGKIHYRDEGNKDGPPILLIHGSNSLLQTWEPLVALLGDKYRMISLDLYGHGLTGPNPTGAYDAETNIATALKILDAVGVDKAYWVGNSRGGWITWRAGLSVPDRTSGLVLIDASGAQIEQTGTPYLGARLAQSWIGQLLLPEITPRLLVKSSLEESFAQPERLTEELVDRYWELLRFPGNRQATLDRGKTPREPEKWGEVGTLKMPVLILWGEQDQVIPLAHARAFAAAIPQSRLITYAEAGHLPMEETPEQVARDIDDWIENVTAEAAAPNPG
ncbi:alpha/beta hydrolase [Parasphingorhabdus sp.]|uniref:alpha/beta fold hydrolase n=1 Tax=Parasphingorhabdus sp. TaxID=2709688 RepID=UPI002B26BD42|nr:alpha/beta hydrolase [Parasphingorhabdus sp.]|tara:strand:- start:5626 stop:6597 length:972 start_codon:yes stop_codon:yes gene_type:complete